MATIPISHKDNEWEDLMDGGLEMQMNHETVGKSLFLRLYIYIN